MRRKISRNYKRGFAQLHHLAPLVVWLAVLVCVVGLFYRRAQRFEVVGIAQGQVHQVAATCTGRLKSVPVEPFQQVKQGQVVAVIDTVLDSEPLRAQLATIAASVEHLMAQLVPTQEQLLAEADNLETTHAADQRRFYVDVENAELRILELRALIASDRITLEDLAMEVKIVQDLLRQDVVAPYEFQKAKAAHDSLAKKVDENERLLEQAKSDLEQARQRRDEFSQRQLVHPSVESALEVIRKEAQVQERLMDELLARSKPVELKAPIDGVVIAIPIRANEALLRRPGEKVLRRAGEVVASGEPILAVAQVQPSEIVAYVGEAQLGQLREKMPIELVKNTPPAQIARSEVMFVGPTVEVMPERLWRNPAIPQWGRPIVVKIPEGLKLVPGELVGIRQL